MGVSPNYVEINNLSMVEGRFFNAEDNDRSAPVCVLGEAAKVNLLGYESAEGKYIKVNDTWLQVIGVVAGQSAADSEVEGLEVGDRNNLILAPLNTVMRRFEDNNSFLHDEIDGIYIKIAPDANSVQTARVINAMLASLHREAGDFNVVAPAGLLEQKRRTQSTFKVVMMCVAGISLLVGGVGIMNIMLATVLERTREIGIRRAIGARQGDIVRQFLTEAVLISVAGGLIGILFGFVLARAIAVTAGWTSTVTFTSIALAFGVSFAIGGLSGVYPALQAAKLHPIEAIRYE